MKPKKRQKICYNCDGEIDLDVIVCPYCAADLREEKPEQHRSAYSPPANVRSYGTGQLHEPLYSPPFPSTDEEDSPAPVREPMAIPEEREKEKNIFGPTLLFTLGVQLFIFGLLMLLFSHKGVLTLKWDGRFWFFYLFASIPLLYFGYRSISRL